MAIPKTKIVIIGAGMAGLTAANRLCKSPNHHLFDISVVEGGARIGGRIKSSEFHGDAIELGATYIHGTEGSPIYKIADESNLLHSQTPWESMNGFSQSPLTAAEGGHLLNPSSISPISQIFKTLINSIRGNETILTSEIATRLSKNLSVGSFLREGFEIYRESSKNRNGVELGFGRWSSEKLEDAIFAMFENIERSISAVDELDGLDYISEKEYTRFPGEDLTIARGYSGVIESLASDLPVGTIQLSRKVSKIEWQPDDNQISGEDRPVKLHFSDGSTMSADHVIVTVSLGVLKRGISEDGGFFDPALPSFKTDAISRLGYGVLDKVFLHTLDSFDFPFLKMVFHEADSDSRNCEIPKWMRRNPSMYPIYRNSRVVVSWLVGRDALEVEALGEDDIVEGFSATVSNLLSGAKEFKFAEALRTRWGSDPLFLGSYSYVAVGSSGDDIDALAEPMPLLRNSEVGSSPQLQILFAGEATHRTLYSTTHGAYLSGVREAERILEHYGL
ncbi:probable polyamine oxidase 5 [Andrographis paniculata]|uniref:probable polyamine oxidase 5 n=1 Tax=Andrographis paniculata TaxID=175694 RepID=UPI0021E893CD|nr:probable polyamine oxidase 5 [Andrographis paniculata]